MTKHLKLNRTLKIRLWNNIGGAQEADLQCEDAVVDLDLLGEEIRADGGLVPVAELIVDIPARTKPRNRSPISTETYYVLLAKKTCKQWSLEFSYDYEFVKKKEETNIWWYLQPKLGFQISEHKYRLLIRKQIHKRMP